MPAAKKKPPATPRYHVYKIDQDMGEVTGSRFSKLEDLISTVSAAYPGQVNGLYIVVSDGGSVDFVKMEPVTNMDVSSFTPKDLFE